MSPILSLVILVNVFLIVGVTTTNARLPKFSSIIVFGDSLVDTGNNFYTNTVPLGNHLPYGKDFPTHKPTGRMSNGKLVPDFIASMLNLKDTVPAYLEPNLTNQELLTGVCFAAAGAGLDNLTGALLKAISMAKQVENFKAYKAKLEEIVGKDETRKILANTLVVVVVGSNDFIFNFYDLPTRSLTFTVHQYQDYLLSKLQKYIQDLYDAGCRKFGISGLPPIGCTPFQIRSRFHFNGKCVEDENTVSKQYNKKLVSLLPQVQARLPGSKLVYVDIFYQIFDLLNRPKEFGMEVTNTGCCGLFKIEVALFCNEFSPVCKDTSKYVFWDSFHFTEIAYFHVAKYVEREILPQFNFL